ncbi:syntaxin-6-like [Centruroides vittatus]|uniref:syntaxin-6-like n=1 Tax=Centruroides vittatus TaxID=120091 RepID=UPI00350FBCD5
MTLEDPFFVVKDEVVTAVNVTKGLYQRWCELQDLEMSKEEKEWTTTELRNSLRSIEWDLDDLEETIGIVEKNPKKFKIDETEIKNRRSFINQAREEVKCMKDAVIESKTKDKKLRQSILSSSLGNTKYIRLQNEIESPTRHFIQDNQVIISPQEEDLGQIKNSIGNLKTISQQMNRDNDEQAVMLDDMSNEMDDNDTRIEGVVKKLTKALHLSNDRKQWAAIGVLSGVMVVVVVLFFMF